MCAKVCSVHARCVRDCVHMVLSVTLSQNISIFLFDPITPIIPQLYSQRDHLLFLRSNLYDKGKTDSS